MKVSRFQTLFPLALILGFSLVPIGNAQNSTSTNAAASAGAAKAKAEREKEMSAAMQASSDRAAEEARQEASQEQPDPNATLVLHDGDPAQFKLLKEVKSDTATLGEPVQFALAQDLSVNGQIVARTGDRAMGEVVWLQKAGLGLQGILLVRLNYLRVGTKKVLLRGSLKIEKGGLVFGSNCTMKAGTILKGFIGDDVKLPPAPPAVTAAPTLPAGVR
jgi:hypothetical protein